MADPITLAIIGGAALSAVGALQQGRAAEAGAATEAQSLENQALISEEQAAQEREIAGLEEEDFRRRERRILAAQRAILGGAGVTFEGTPLLVAQDTAAAIERGALRIRRGGEIRAGRLRQQAGVQRQQASITRTAGRQARQASFFRAGAGLLQGVGTAGALGLLGGGGSVSVPAIATDVRGAR